MTLSAWLEQAKDGDAEAIAALLNQSLKPQGVEVRAERDSYCLNLWLTGATLPPQAQLEDYLQRTIERLQIDCIGILHIDANATQQPGQSWTTEMTLLAGLVQRNQRTPERRTPIIWDTSANGGPDQTCSHPHGRQPLPIPHQDEGAAGEGHAAESTAMAEPNSEIPPKVARAYQELQIHPDASLADIESAYFKTKAALLRQGRRDEVEPLKWAFNTLKTYLETPPPTPTVAADLASDSSQEFSDLAGGTETDSFPLGFPPLGSPELATPPSPRTPIPGLAPGEDPAQALQTLLQARGLPAQVSHRDDQLHIRWPAVRVMNPKRATAQIYALLAQQDLAPLGLGEVKTLVVTALDSRNRAVWRQTLTMPQRPTVEEDTDLSSFNNRYSNGLFFPALLVIGILLNAMPITNALLFGIKLWIHEFGHATVAWLAGRQAIPLPIGWTNVNPQRSFFVYLGLLILLGLLYWSGQREGKRWPMVLAVGLALVQFAMTWLMSPKTFDMLLAFGGIGGELYLSTLLMVSFFFPMPDYWRWDLYRYPVVLGAAFTFWGQFWLWKAIRLGRASIPFGMMWGDPEHGDMNILVNRHQWEPGTLIGTYNTIANLCFLALVGVYAYVLYRQHRHRAWLFYQRWIS